MMKIFVPTRNRDVSLTARQLKEAKIPFTFVTTKDTSAPIAEGEQSVSVQAAHIGEKRQRILELAGDDKFVMLDDDLSLFRRISDVKFTPATKFDLHYMFALIEVALDHTALAGIIPRFWAQSKPRGLIRHARFDQVLAYNPNLFTEPKPEFRPHVAEEHDFNLQIAAQGHAAIILTEFCKNDQRYAPGGCNSWRTPEIELQGLTFVADAHKDKGVKLVPDQKTLSGYRIAAPWAKITPKHKEVKFEELSTAALQLLDERKILETL